MPRYRITISGPDENAMADLIRKHRIRVSDHGVQSSPGSHSVDAIADDNEIRTLEANGYQVARHEDVDVQGRLRQAEVGQGNRYLNVDEVESALKAATGSDNASFTQLISLPNPTWENRQCHAVKIGKGSGSDRKGVYFLGGVHAREWGSPDMLVRFVEDLTRAYRTNQGLTLGNKGFSASDLQTIVNSLDILVFPQANPDGRHHSMTADPMWRKNRRPAPPGLSSPDCIGVDINRNYDFLWDFPNHFSPQAPIANSTDPCDPEVYIGPEPVSERETLNAVWLLDNYPSVRFFIDVHSYGEDILYPWGDDEAQTADPNMSFLNSSYDQLRGVKGDTAYREYILSADLQLAKKLAVGMKDAIHAVRGRTYKAEPSFALYPTAGASDDYAFSRHLADTTKPKIIPFTIEWGSRNNPTPFHPPYQEMKQIIAEVEAGLLEFCLQVTSLP